jgi:hypothetical protein
MELLKRYFALPFSLQGIYLGMTRTQMIVFYGLMVAGVLLYPLYSIFSNERNYTVQVWGGILILAALLFQVIVLWRARRYAQLKRIGLRMGVFIGVLFVLILIYGF